ncbi:MAG: outer membrane protein assembly factor BamB [Methylobacter tundripaludum]|uniref:Outer membrane protein assembly factor BamB n=2 Tax=Methylobacter tundripaludum TaxID=173365 RepID=A0A2S6H4M0_9GAMM|nr:outer membrane protein assembly factor BamB [Methylobacter tundripaludum]MCF7965675.1 outer membrane protein assembly factor BamB [Methylobacter tundripaludum]MCK9635943.1 outer membrane protein assembly factor BamB [Methylobacter tundripaludum]PPK72381.1 Beta-barrel assembly machine subunit BamB [Methylobacter tundripaludum]
MSNYSSDMNQANGERREAKGFFAFCLLSCIFLLTGCAAVDTLKEGVSGISDYFLGGEDNADPPNVLVEYTPEIQLEVLWKESVGVGADEQSLKLIPAIGSGKILAADREGVVQARSLTTGNLIWATETEVHFSGGPGLGAGSLILGSSDAEVVALDIETGAVLWKSTVSSEVLSVPVVGDGIVVVRTTDGSVIALDEKTGGKRWSYERSVPALSVRGTGSPLIVEDNVIGGYDNGKVMALRLTDGKYVWETSIAVSKGRSEIERLVDLDVDPIVINGVIYVASYQGGLAAISELDGDVLWRNETISSHSGLSHDSRYLYLSDTQSHVMQLDQRSGASLWTQKDLHQRRLTAPAAYGNYVVAGDFEGYVHWFSNLDGRQLGRVQVTEGAIDAKPVVVDNTVYVYAKDGTLAALKVR